MVEATVVSVRLNVKGTSNAGSSYTYHELITQADPYKGKAKEPRTHRIFDNSELAPEVEKLKEGMRIIYGVDDSRYKNINSIEVLSFKDESGTQQRTAAGNDYAAQEAIRQAHIVRSVALKAASDIVSAGMAREGLFKKTEKLEGFAVQTIELAKLFEPYLNLDDELNLPEVGDTTPDEDIPF